MYIAPGKLQYINHQESKELDENIYKDENYTRRMVGGREIGKYTRSPVKFGAGAARCSMVYMYFFFFFRIRVFVIHRYTTTCCPVFEEIGAVP